MLFDECIVDVFVYRLITEEAVEEEDESGEFANFQMLGLPHASLHGLWETLVYSTALKSQLLNYVYTAMLFSQRKVNPHVVGWNRVVLLHGPPGTGKTSLCKALAHQLAVLLRRQYVSYDLVEINAHSLFSKWFSESGKLVLKMFGAIRELASDPQRFVAILIDEVESLTAARSKALQGTEPSDAIRVVNAVLTELDKLKQLPNIFVFTTSNITTAIDEAFLDRADIVQYIGPPGVQARYDILAQCLNELIDKDLVQPNSLPFSPKSLHASSNTSSHLSSQKSAHGSNHLLSQKSTHLPHSHSSHSTNTCANSNSNPTTTTATATATTTTSTSSLLSNDGASAGHTPSTHWPALDSPEYIVPSFSDLVRLFELDHDVTRTMDEHGEFLPNMRDYIALILQQATQDISTTHNWNSNAMDTARKIPRAKTDGGWTHNQIASLKLLESASLLNGLSGRALRKLPFVAASVVLLGASKVSAFRFAEAIGIAGVQFGQKRKNQH